VIVEGGEGLCLKEASNNGSRTRCPEPRPALMVFGVVVHERPIGSGSIGATFQLAAKFGIGRSAGIRNATLISLTFEERRARPLIG
jgi:hypothetical protein